MLGNFCLNIRFSIYAHIELLEFGGFLNSGLLLIQGEQKDFDLIQKLPNLTPIILSILLFFLENNYLNLII